MTESKPPIIVQCKLCDERIILREDSQEARESEQDPLQQLRRHLYEKHLSVDIARLAHWAGWLIDRLVFRAVQGEERWRSSAHELLDHLMKSEPGEERRWIS
jgi:hypothetical protein